MRSAALPSSGSERDDNVLTGHLEGRVRVVVIDDNPAIHDDIRKILAPPNGGRSNLDNLGADLFGGAGAGPEPQRVRFEIDGALQGQIGHAIVQAAAQAGDPYAVAFVDVRMPPGWDGIETIEKLWEVDPSLQVVLCTAFSDHSWQEISRRLARMDGWLALKKPFDSIEVLQAAHALWNKWQLGRMLRHEFNSLEGMVAARTRELKQLNEQLTREIDAHRVTEENLRHLATHDSLTGLANRTLLRDRLEHAIIRARRFKSELAVLSLDLDGFKDINDSLGHDAGDLVLKAVAGRLKRCARECDTVARVGGDEFALLLPDMRGLDDGNLVAERILAAFAEPLELGVRTFDLAASIGISVFGRDADDTESLLKCADLAMYDAKRLRKSSVTAGPDKKLGRSHYRSYAPENTSRRNESMVLRDELKDALAQDQLFLMYQPLIDLATAEVVGFEALVRWRHPSKGIISPARFLPLAEELGLMSSLGRWVLRTVCACNAQWQRGGLRAVPIAVNLSAAELEEEDLVQSISTILRESMLDPRFLEIEVTETSAMGDVERTLSNMSRLHDLGVRVMIDDFGVGLSSLGRLKMLPVDGVKIDQSFIREITNDPRDAVIVATMISLAGSLGLQVVAEGIETQGQLECLRKIISTSAAGTLPLKCPLGQGFLFSRPVPSEDAMRLLLEGSIETAQPTRKRAVSAV